MARRLVSLLLLFALADCRTPHREDGDLRGGTEMAPLADLATVPADAVAPLDLTATRDGPCATEEYGPVTLDAIELLEPAGSHRLGAVIRLKLLFTMRACDYVATTGQQVTPGNATDFVRFTTYLWRRRGFGAGCERMVTGSRVVDVSQAQLTNLQLIASDGTPGGTASLTVPVGPKPPVLCNQAIPLGQPCQLDCQCLQPNGMRFQCIPRAPNQGICARSCAEDSECPADLPLCDADAAIPYTCNPARPDGSCPHRCAPGTRCEAGACRPQPRPAAAACQCDQDCPATQFCDATRTCFVPCFTVASCPAGANYCGFGKCGFR